MSLTKAVGTVVASATNAASATTYGTISMASTYGGILTLKITNGSTGPTVQCTCNVLIAHNTSTPSASTAGTDWKTIYSFGGGTTASTVTEQSVLIDASVIQLEVQFVGNTGQSVTVEAYISQLTGV